MGLSPDDRTFAAGNGSGEVRLFRADGSPVGKAFNPHDSKETVLGAVVFPEGETTASFVRDGQKVTYCRFDGEVPCVPTSVELHRGSIAALALSPDGQTLATVGIDGTVGLIRAHWTTWLATACDRLRNHPILQDTVTTDAVNAKRIRETRETCQERVWAKKK